MRVKFGDVVVRANTKEDRFNTDKLYYVGGEHIETGEYLVTKRGLIAGSNIGPMFYFGFRKGQVLLASRSPDLKKAGMVTFDGICSEKTFVIETRDENILLQSFLPIIVRSEAFWEYANNNQSGSVNHFINWSTFSAYEFDLPSLEEQRQLSEIVWAMVDAQRAYKALIVASDELVKSQFIERIGKGSYKAVPAGTVMYNMRNGVSPSKNGTYREKVLTLSAVTQGEFDANAWKDGSFDECPPPEKRITSTDFYMCRGNGNKTLVGRGVIAPEDRPDLVFPDTVIAATIDTDRIMIPFLFYAWQQDTVRRQIEIAARTTNGTYKINQAIISGIDLILPPVEAQKGFIAFASQLDKSKHSAQKALEDLQATQKALIRKYLG